MPSLAHAGITPDGGQHSSTGSIKPRYCQCVPAFDTDGKTSLTLSAADTAEAEELAPDSKDPFDQLLPVNFTVEAHPPFEEQLLGSTLWPEVRLLLALAFCGY